MTKVLTQIIPSSGSTDSLTPVSILGTFFIGNGSEKCVIDRQGQMTTVNVSGYVYSGGIWHCLVILTLLGNLTGVQCTMPPRSQGSVTVEVFVSNVNGFFPLTNSSVTFTYYSTLASLWLTLADCSSRWTCGNCQSTLSPECRWCENTGICTSSPQSCATGRLLNSSSCAGFYSPIYLTFFVPNLTTMFELFISQIPTYSFSTSCRNSR